MENKASYDLSSFRVCNTNGNDSSDMYDVEVPEAETGHQISHDSWLQAGCILTTSINCAYVLGYPATIMVPLGWYGEIIGLLAMTAISLYASCLTAEFHENGGKRYVRYRDLAGSLFGNRAYALTWTMQYMNLFTINSGLIIMAGSALKSVYVLFRDDDLLKLPSCITIAGFVCAFFAIGVPNLSSLGTWLGISTVLGSVYFVVAFVLALQDGIKAPEARDYSIPAGSSMSKICKSVGAIANLVFALNTGMLPEIQATVRKPAIKNMHRALYFQFIVGNLPLYATTIIGYWAYGSSTPVYLLSAVSGPIWLKASANIFTFLQTVVAVHIYASPIYEYMDTKFGMTAGNSQLLMLLRNRILLRGGYMAIATFLSALMPFFGEFMSLTGAICMIPLTFVLTSMMYLAAKGDELSSLHKLWHRLIVCYFGILSVAATLAAFRLIAVDFRTYSFFADV